MAPRSWPGGIVIRDWGLRPSRKGGNPGCGNQPARVSVRFVDAPLQSNSLEQPTSQTEPDANAFRLILRMREPENPAPGFMAVFASVQTLRDWGQKTDSVVRPNASNACRVNGPAAPGLDQPYGKPRTLQVASNCSSRVPSRIAACKNCSVYSRV